MSDRDIISSYGEQETKNVRKRKHVDKECCISSCFDECCCNDGCCCHCTCDCCSCVDCDCCSCI